MEMPKFLELKDKDIVNNKMHRWLAFFDSNISDTTLKEVIKIDTAINQTQKKIEYISYNEEDYRQIILREQALLDYHSDMNAYKIEGIIEGEKKMAINLIKMGLTNGQISKSTDYSLSEEDIEALRIQHGG